MLRLPWRAAIVGSSARLPGVLIAVVGSVLVFVEPDPRWIWFVQDTGMYLSVFSFAIAGSLCSVAGYVTGSRRLAGATELARGVRPLSAATAHAYAGDLAWLLGGLAVVHVAAYVRALSSGALFSTMGWSLEVLSVASASMCYALGVLIGVGLRHPVGLIVAAVVPYGLTLISNQFLQSDPALQPIARLAAPFIDQTWGPQAVPAHGPILLLASYALCLGVTAAQLVNWSVRMRFAAAPARRPRRRALVAPVGALVAAGMVAGTVSASDYFTWRTDGWACSDDGRICAWDRGNGVDVALWDTALDRVLAAMEGAPVPDLRFAEYGIPDDESEGRVTLPSQPGKQTVEAIASVIVPEYTWRLVESECTVTDAWEVDAAIQEAVFNALNQQGEPEPGLIQEQLRACA
jgi:hypothetical protein